MNLLELNGDLPPPILWSAVVVKRTTVSFEKKKRINMVNEVVIDGDSPRQLMQLVSLGWLTLEQANELYQLGEERGEDVEDYVRDELARYLTQKP
jgi:hypothetical protein